MTEKRKKKHETQEQASEKEWLKLSHMKRERERVILLLYNAEWRWKQRFVCFFTRIHLFI